MGIYLDAQATEVPRPESVQAMMPFFGDQFGNPHSTQSNRGKTARKAIEEARDTIAGCLGASIDGVIFTSGATEANNLALRSFLSLHPGKGILTSSIEHKSVLMAANVTGLSRMLPVSSSGIVEVEQLRSLLTPDLGLVSIMAANNEIGTLQPIAEVGRLCRERGILFHVDAAQAAGKLELDLVLPYIDFMAISAHKIGGPVGVGALIFDPGSRLELSPLMVGGGQEQGLRSGTLSPALCVGFAAALSVACARREVEWGRMVRLRDALIDRLREEPGFSVNGDLRSRLPNNLNGRFADVDAFTLMRTVPEVEFSTGSACSSGQASHVLRAIGLTDREIDGSFRLSIGWSTSSDEVEAAGDQLLCGVRSLRRSR